MTTELTLSLQTVRLLQLAVQGLLNPPTLPAGKDSVLAAIRRMGVLQIDTIHVVARSPYLVLFSRLGQYDPRWLDELLAEGSLFEYWAHAACFLPIEDYPLLYYRMARQHHPYYGEAWHEEHADTIARVLARIREQGEVRSADFERKDGQKGTWWNWKIEKQVLEYLHTSGLVMIARRENFQRVYDLRERILPDWREEQAYSQAEAQDRLSERAVRLLGAAPARWAHDYYRLPRTGMPQRLDRLVEAGRLERVVVDGFSDPWYLHPENRLLAEQAVAGELVPTLTTLLSPFDPLTWDRERARTLFNFDYSIECYLPESKRIYGYFSLPILNRGRLVGRLDAKAHRKDRRFEVKNLVLEAETTVTEELAQEVAAAIQRCANWHATPQVEITRCEPEIFKEMLQKAVPC